MSAAHAVANAGIAAIVVSHDSAETLDECLSRLRAADGVVEIRVVEHANHGGAWILTAQSQPHEKKDAQTFEFRVPLKPDEEKVVTYTIRYTW